MKHKNRAKVGTLLFVLLLASYLLFAVAWISGGFLSGDSHGGYLLTFLPSIAKHPNSLTSKIFSQVSPAAVSIAGIGASFLGGWLLVKLGHQKSVYVAMTLISIGIIAPWFGGRIVIDGDVVKKDDWIGFILFFLARIALSTGGIIVFIYIQPIIANYFDKRETKAFFARLTPLAYNIGTIIATIPFAISLAFNKTLIEHWRITATVFALPILIVIALFAWKSEDFSLSSDDEETKSMTMKDIFKDREAVLVAFVYSIWMVIVITPLYFAQLLPKLHKAFSKEHGAMGYFGWTSIYIIGFVGGLFIGIFTVSKFNKTRRSRKGFLMLMFGIGLIGFIITFIGAIYGEIFTTLLGGIISGIVLWGMQGIIGGLPHELQNNNAERVGLIYSLMSAMSYSFLLISTLAFGLIIGINGSGVETNITSPYLDGNGKEIVQDNISTGAIIYISLICSLTLLCIPLLIFLPSSNFYHN